MKDQTTAIILILLLVGAFLYLQAEPQPLGITVDYYNKGKKVSGLFAAYIKYDQIRINIHASNAEALKISNIQLVDASPPIFKENMPIISLETLEPGEKNKLILSSNLINTDSFVLMSQPVVFWVKISGKDEYDNTIYEESSMSLTFVDKVSPIEFKQIASNTDYNDGGDIMVMLSGTRWVAFDNSAKDIVLTTNSGGDWNIILADTTDTMYKHYVNPNNPDYITFFSHNTGGKAFYSEDAGGSWTEITMQGDGDTNYQSFSITDSGRIYCIQNDGGVGEIWYTDNGGTGWTQVTGHQTFTPNSYAAIATPKDDIIVYGSGNTGPDCGYSLNGGSSWTEAGRGPWITHAFYIDSNNYLISVGNNGNNAGVHIVKWKGTTISSSSTSRWGGSVPDDSNTVLMFDGSDFIYDEAKTKSTYKYDSDGNLYIISGRGKRLHYHGVSDTSGEGRILIKWQQWYTPGDPSCEQHELWTTT